MTGTRKRLPGPFEGVGVAALPGEEERLEVAERSYLVLNSSVESSLLIARKAVGAVKSVFALCCEITRQKAPASGVPTGLPSYRIVVFPWRKRAIDDVGVAMMDLMSEAVQKTSPGSTPEILFIDHLRATAWPPLSRTTPLALPVVPEV